MRPVFSVKCSFHHFLKRMLKEMCGPKMEPLMPRIPCDKLRLSCQCSVLPSTRHVALNKVRRATPTLQLKPNALSCPPIDLLAGLARKSPPPRPPCFLPVAPSKVTELTPVPREHAPNRGGALLPTHGLLSLENGSPDSLLNCFIFVVQQGPLA